MMCIAAHYPEYVCPPPTGEFSLEGVVTTDELAPGGN